MDFIKTSNEFMDEKLINVYGIKETKATIDISHTR